MLAVLRRWRLPCRYVSGYLAPEHAAIDRAPPSSRRTPGSRCACPGSAGSASIPTNNIDAGVRHIRVAVGRDYADVPPTRGIFKGGAGSELSVSVEVSAGGVMPPPDPASVETSWVAKARPAVEEERRQKQMQQQQ